MLHKTDLVRCRSCQKTVEPPFSPDYHQPSRVRPRRVIELGSGLFQANTRRAFLSFLLDTILDTRRNFVRQDWEQNIFIIEKSDDDDLLLKSHKRKSIKVYLNMIFKHNYFLIYIF